MTLAEEEQSAWAVEGCEGGIESLVKFAKTTADAADRVAVVDQTRKPISFKTKRLCGALEAISSTEASVPPALAQHVHATLAAVTDASAQSSTDTKRPSEQDILSVLDPVFPNQAKPPDNHVAVLRSICLSASLELLNSELTSFAISSSATNSTQTALDEVHRRLQHEASALDFPSNTSSQPKQCRKTSRRNAFKRSSSPRQEQPEHIAKRKQRQATYWLLRCTQASQTSQQALDQLLHFTRADAQLRREDLCDWLVIENPSIVPVLRFLTKDGSEWQQRSATLLLSSLCVAPPTGEYERRKHALVYEHDVTSLLLRAIRSAGSDSDTRASAAQAIASLSSGTIGNHGTEKRMRDLIFSAGVVAPLLEQLRFFKNGKQRVSTAERASEALPLACLGALYALTSRDEGSEGERSAKRRDERIAGIMNTRIGHELHSMQQLQPQQQQLQQLQDEHCSPLSGSSSSAATDILIDLFADNVTASTPTRTLCAGTLINLMNGTCEEAVEHVTSISTSSGGGEEPLIDTLLRISSSEDVDESLNTVSLYALSCVTAHLQPAFLEPRLYKCITLASEALEGDLNSVAASSALAIVFNLVCENKRCCTLYTCQVVWRNEGCAHNLVRCIGHTDTVTQQKMAIDSVRNLLRPNGPQKPDQLFHLRCKSLRKANVIEQLATHTSRCLDTARAREGIQKEENEDITACLVSATVLLKLLLSGRGSSTEWQRNAADIVRSGAAANVLSASNELLGCPQLAKKACRLVRLLSESDTNCRVDEAEWRSDVLVRQNCADTIACLTLNATSDEDKRQALSTLDGLIQGKPTLGRERRLNAMQESRHFEQALTRAANTGDVHAVNALAAMCISPKQSSSADGRVSRLIASGGCFKALLNVVDAWSKHDGTDKPHGDPVLTALQGIRCVCSNSPEHSELRIAVDAGAVRTLLNVADGRIGLGESLMYTMASLKACCAYIAYAQRTDAVSNSTLQSFGTLMSESMPEEVRSGSIVAVANLTGDSSKAGGHLVERLSRSEQGPALLYAAARCDNLTKANARLSLARLAGNIASGGTEKAAFARRERAAFAGLCGALLTLVAAKEAKVRIEALWALRAYAPSIRNGNSSSAVWKALIDDGDALAVLESFSDDSAEAQRVAAKTLHVLLCGSEQQAVLLGEADDHAVLDAVNELRRMLRSKSHVHQERAAADARAMAQKGDVRRLQHLAGCSAELLELLERTDASERSQRNALQAIALAVGGDSTTREERIQRWSSSGLLEKVAATLTHYETMPENRVNAAVVLAEYVSGITAVEASKHEIAENENVLDALNQCIANNSNSDESLRAARHSARALRNITSGERDKSREQRCENVSNVNSLQHALSCAIAATKGENERVEKRDYALELKHEALLLLRNLGSGYESAAKDKRKNVICSSEVVHLLVHELRAPAADCDPVLRKEVAAAAQSLMSGAMDNARDERMRSFADAGGLDALLATAHNPAGSESARMHAVGAIKSCVVGADRRACEARCDALVQSGGLNLLADLARNPSKEVGASHVTTRVLVKGEHVASEDYASHLSERRKLAVSALKNLCEGPASSNSRDGRRSQLANECSSQLVELLVDEELEVRKSVSGIISKLCCGEGKFTRAQRLENAGAQSALAALATKEASEQSDVDQQVNEALARMRNTNLARQRSKSARKLLKTSTA
jgi:hypothetical protein